MSNNTYNDLQSELFSDLPDLELDPMSDLFPEAENLFDLGESSVGKLPENLVPQFTFQENSLPTSSPALTAFPVVKVEPSDGQSQSPSLNFSPQQTAPSNTESDLSDPEEWHTESKRQDKRSSKYQKKIAKKGVLPKIKSESVRQQLLQILPATELASSPLPSGLPKRRRHQTKPQSEEERHQRRLEANRLAAQASRDRKKLRRFVLERQIDELETSKQETLAELNNLQSETENLKQEFVQLQQFINNCLPLAKIQARQELDRLSALHSQEQGPDAQSQAQAQTTAWLAMFLHMFGDQLRNSVQTPAVAHQAVSC